MNKQHFFTLLYIILILVVIATCIFMMIWLKSESTSCLVDPIKYYANKTGQFCYCGDPFGFAP